MKEADIPVHLWQNWDRSESLLVPIRQVRDSPNSTTKGQWQLCEKTRQAEISPASANAELCNILLFVLSIVCGRLELLLPSSMLLSLGKVVQSAPTSEELS